MSRAIGPARELPPEALARVQARLQRAVLAPRRGWIKPTAAGALLLGGASALWFALAEPRPAPPLPYPRAPAWRAEAGKPPAPAKPAGPLLEPPRPVAVRPAVARKPGPGPVPAPDASQLVEESRLLGAAVKRLRKERDPAGALAILDGYFARYPAGQLVLDARAVRVEALLAMDRKQEALAQLDAMAREGFAGLPRAAELNVTHGELLAGLGRFVEAARAYDEILSKKEAPSDLEERALFGRANCRARTGDAEGSRADLELYLERFPRGRFAGVAQAALGPSGGLGR